MRRRFTRSRDDTKRAQELRRNASRTERRLWPHLRDDRLGASFRRQYFIRPYFADYCCLPLRLIVEVDGPEHSLSRDSVRDAKIRSRGFDILRFSVQEIDKNLNGVVETIWEAVQLKLAEQRRQTPSPFQGVGTLHPQRPQIFLPLEGGGAPSTDSTA